MIELYTWTTPNGRKVSVMLEETGLEYSVHPVNLQMGEQHEAGFRAIAPNGRIPAIIDRAPDGAAPGQEPVSIFESGAILIHLAEKTGQFLPTGAGARAKVLEWLMWQMAGFGPMLGQAGYFINSAPERIPYAIDRYLSESARLFKVLDTRLADVEYVAGAYSIADMAIYPWAVAGADPILAAKPDVAGEGVHLRRWLAAVGGRDAVQRGMKVPEVPSI